MRSFPILALGLLSLAPLACGSAGQATSGTTTGAGGAGGVVTGASDASSSAATATAATTAGSSGSGAGGAGGSSVCPPAGGPFDGAKLVAPPKAWTWVDLPGTHCRDGSPTGIGVRLNPASDKLYIYLEGGGACFNGTTCAINPANFNDVSFAGWAGTIGQIGIFNPLNPANPVEDWNAIYVPYCTGDVHIGDASGVSVPGGPSGQDFVGYANFGVALKRIVPTFALASQVLLTGSSAGGFGAAFNYDRVASAFCPTKVALLDDSGPPMSDAYLAPCLQQQWRDLYALDKTLPAGCPQCSAANGGGIVNYASYLGARWPDAPLGLLSSTHDGVITVFYGFGANDCKLAVPMSGPMYEAGLVDLRDNYLAKAGHWGTYYVDSTTHTYLLGPGFYLTSVQGKPLTTWVKEFLAGTTSNVAP